MGEFVLVRSVQDKYELNIQARYQQVHPNQYGPVAASRLTSVAGTLIKSFITMIIYYYYHLFTIKD